MTATRRIGELANRIDALSLRERAMLMVGAFMVLFLLWDTFLMSGIEAQRKVIAAEIKAAQGRVEQLNQAIATASRQAARDPKQVLSEALRDTRAHIADLDARLAERSSQVVPPREMAKVLEEILQRQGRLKLVSAQSLAPTRLFESAAGEEVPGTVYRHGLAIEIEGRYLDVLAYLGELESLDWQFFWDAVELESADYPTNRVLIRIYTLNFEEGWLGV